MERAMSRMYTGAHTHTHTQTHTHTHTHCAVMLHMKGVSNGILVRPVWPCCTELRSLIPYQQLRERERERIWGGSRVTQWEKGEENKGTHQQNEKWTEGTKKTERKFSFSSEFLVCRCDLLSISCFILAFQLLSFPYFGPSPLPFFTLFFFSHLLLPLLSSPLLSSPLTPP